MIPRNCRVLIWFVLFLMLFAGVGGAGATTIRDSDFTCQLCGKAFKDKVIWSTNVMERDSEFRPYAMGIDPLPYYVHTCPYCGYTDGRDNIKLNDHEKAEIRKFLKAYRTSHESLISPAGKYEILANISTIRKLPADQIAYAYQRAAWMADDAGDETSARKFRAATLEYLTKALETGKADPKTTPFLTYLAGELNRRLGHFDEAVQWFAKVKPDNPGLKDLVAKQTELAKKHDAGAEKMLRLR